MIPGRVDNDLMLRERVAGQSPDRNIFKMNLWRMLLVLLLIVAVPSYGLGTVRLHDNYPAAHMAGAEKASMSDSCCGDMGGGDQKSNHACSTLCSTSGDCRGLNVLPPATGTEPGVTSHVPIFALASVRIAAFDPSAVWRPPCTL